MQVLSSQLIIYMFLGGGRGWVVNDILNNPLNLNMNE